MKTLESYVLGRWHAPEGSTRNLIDPSTEAELACCGTGGIDFGEVLAYARDTGGPALRALGFKRRGEILKELSGAIYEHRDELLDLSMECAGTTRGDAKFDVDGATGTLAAYAHFAKELEDTVSVITALWVTGMNSSPCRTCNMYMDEECRYCTFLGWM